MPSIRATWTLLAAATLLGSPAAAATALSGGVTGQQGLASADAADAAGPALNLLPQPPPEDAAGEADNPHHKAVMAWADRQAQRSGGDAWDTCHPPSHTRLCIGTMDAVL